MAVNVREVLASAGLSLIVEPKQKPKREPAVSKNGSGAKNQSGERTTANAAKQR